ncbi:MAG: MFS transporter [Candidatus Nanohaloarchaea archaeon]
MFYVLARPTVTRERIAVLMLSATHGMQHFFGRIFPPLIPLLATDLQLPLWKLGLIVSLWSGANGIAQAPLGHLSDRLDRRYILPTGVAVVGLGYLIVAASTRLGTHLPTLQVHGVEWTGTLLGITLGMVVAGIGKAATHPTGYPLLTRNVADANKGTALGRWGSASKLGDAAGPAFVGVAILALPWQAVFTIIAGIATAYAAFLFLYMTRSTLQTVPDPDPAGMTDGDTDYIVPVFLVLLAFMAASFASRGIGTYLPTYITDVYGFSFTLFDIAFGPESVASMYYSVLLLTGAAAMVVVGDLVDRYDPRSIMIVL